MKKKFTYYLPALLMLMACLGYTPTTRADVNPDDPFASIELTPAPGTVTDMSGFQTITVTLANSTGKAGGEAYIGGFNTLAPMLLQQDNGDGTWTDIGKYSTSATKLDADVMTAWTVKLNTDLSTKELTPGNYRIITKSGSFRLTGGVLGTSAKNVPANVEWNYTYASAAGEVAASVTPGKGGIVAADDFTGFTVAFEGATKVELMA